MTYDAKNACEFYGAAREDIHFAGYSWERACKRIEWLLEDDTRWRCVGPGFNDVNEFIASLRLSNFKALADQRKRLVTRIKDLQPKTSQRAIGKMMGVHHSTVQEDLRGGNPPPNDQEAAETLNAAEENSSPSGGNPPPPSISGAEAAALVARKEKKLEAAEETKAKREASREAEPLPDSMELRIGDCRQVLADVPDNSVPLILTDPPYGDEAEPLYRWLAEFAARKLIPGGSLICYTGQSRLNRDIKIFDATLRWWWQLVMPHHQSQRLPGKFVIANYKPVLWFVKDHRRGRSLVPDVLHSPARAKAMHAWGQGDGGVGPLIEHLTDPGELIVDPFAGTAAWGQRAHSMGRRWLGADIVQGASESVEAAE